MRVIVRQEEDDVPANPRRYGRARIGSAVEARPSQACRSLPFFASLMSLVRLVGLAAVLVASVGSPMLLAQETEEAVQKSKSFPAKSSMKKVVSPSGVVKPKVSIPEHKLPSGQPPEQAKPSTGATGAKPESAKSTDQPSGATRTPATVVRPTDPGVPADPEELKIHLSEGGKFRFNFKGQPWPGILEAIADVSGLSLDWQELPGDYLNLVTQREYTVAEARDVINRHLLLRGYTMLRVGEVLSIVKVDKLNPSMLPRVAPEELKDRDNYEFVKVSFQLDWLLADQAVTELKPMLSPNGSMTALTSTNRLEAIDTVCNLREVYRLLTEEQSRSGREYPVREFPLEHARAADVVDQLQTFLGIAKPGGRGMPMTPQQLQQMQQALAKAAQSRSSSRSGSSKPEKPKREEEVHLLANERENTVIATAPPDKMIVIEQTIAMLDRRSSDQGSLLLNSDRMQVYRLAGVDPEMLVKVLQQTANLEPTTRIEIDAKNKAIIAFASLADHLIIRNMVERLDGSAREIYVFNLHKHDADYLAGTIKAMMGVDEQSQNQNPYAKYFGYSRWGSSQQQSSDKFSVEADVEYNRLLVRANEIELKEIEDLLIKLGEISAPGGNPDTIRVLDSLPAEEAEQLIEQIQRLWPSYSPNKLKIDPSLSIPADDADKPDAKETDEPSPAPPRRSAPVRTTVSNDVVSASPAGRVSVEHNAPSLDVPDGNQQDRDADVVLLPARPHVQLLAMRASSETEPEEPNQSQADSQSSSAAADAADAPTRTRHHPSDTMTKDSKKTPGGEPPVVTIGRAPDGRLVISSQDTEALDLLEELIADHVASRPDFKLFKLKYPTTWAYGIELMLEEYFQDEQKQSGSRSRYYDPFWGGYHYGSSGTDNSRRLSRRRPLKFISDDDTRTILVQGADAQQLKTIEELIDLWDQPASEESQLIRKTQMFQIRYSRASTIADTVKDVYRDLLSENDKALQKGDKEKRQSMSYTYVYGGYGNDSSSREGQSPIRFKGLLSIGVDDVSNQLVVSASEELLDGIAQIIQTLDEAARPKVDTVRVVPAKDIANALLLQQKLSGILGSSTSKSRSTSAASRSRSTTSRSRSSSQKSSSRRR